MVEGVKDATQIRNAFKGISEVTIVITEGTKINNRIKIEIESYLKLGYNIYILSDPDDAGEQLTQMIQSWYPFIPRIEVDFKFCAYYTGKRMKSGIEYASYNYLRKILCPYMKLEYIEKVNPICWD